MDAKAFMEQLLAEDIPDYSEWWNNCREVRDLLDEYDDTEGNKLMKAISEVLPENPTVTVDIGQNVCWAAQSLYFNGNEGRIIMWGGFGALGVCKAYSIGGSISKGNCL